MLVRSDPFRQFDRLAEQVYGTIARPAAMPMDAWRDGNEFVVEFDLPGIDPASIDLDVERNVLTVRADRQPRTGPEVELGLELSVRGLEGQDGRDAGQIKAVVEEPADLSEADEVVVAVATGATLAAGWIDQAPGLVQPEILGSAAHQFGGYGDPVQAQSCIGTIIRTRRSTLRKFSETTCLGHGLQGITNL